MITRHILTTDIYGRPLMIWRAEEKSKMDLFFPWECLWRRLLEIYFSLDGEGPLKFFFSISSGPPSRSLMVVPLIPLESCMATLGKNSQGKKLISYFFSATHPDHFGDPLLNARKKTAT